MNPDEAWKRGLQGRRRLRRPRPLVRSGHESETARRRRSPALRHRAGTRPRCRDLHGPGCHRHRGHRALGHDRAECGRAGHCRCAVRRTGGRARRARRHPRRGVGAPDAVRPGWSRRIRAGSGSAGHRLHRSAQRPAARLLPLHLHRRLRRYPHHRHHPVRVNRRPPGLPLLRRARAEGDLRDDAGCAGGPAGGLQHGGDRPAVAAGRPRERQVRHHDADVDVSSGLRGGTAGGHRSDRLRRGAGASDPPARPE